VDTNTDPANCGTCQNACSSGQICNGGNCQLVCPSGQTDCNSVCTNTDHDPNNCGVCNNACTASQACKAGSCVEIVTGVCDWNPALFPLSFTNSNSVGDMTFDANCDLFFTGDGGDLYKVPYNTSNITKIHDFSSNSRGIVYNPNDGLLYVTVTSQVYSITTTGSNATALAGTSVGSYLNGMTIAPTGWGNYGGHLIVARNNGSVYAINPSNPSPTIVGTTTGELSDVEFDGQTLYVAAEPQKKVLTLSSSGSFATLGTLPCDVDGLAIDSGVRVFASCGDTNQIHEVTIPGGVDSVAVASSALNGGWAPAGMIWDGNDNLIVMEDGLKLAVYSP